MEASYTQNQIISNTKKMILTIFSQSHKVVAEILRRVAYKLRFLHSKPIKAKANRILLSLRIKIIVAKMKLLSLKNETIIFRTTAS